MNKKSPKFRAVRFLSLLLVLAMVCSLIPPVHVRAADEPSLKITNAKGEETDTFVVGEPIYVTATSNISGDWVGFYDMNYPATSAFWYYVDGSEGTKSWVNGETYNIYDGVPNAGWEGWMMVANDPEDATDDSRYQIKLVEANITKTITIIAPEDAAYSSLEVENATITAGESVRVNATSYKQSAWVAVYSGTKSAADTFGSNYIGYQYVTGHNGIYMDFPVYTAGDYTVVLFADGGYTVDKVLYVTVEEDEDAAVILSTDKDTYALGEPIMVTVDTSAYSSTSVDWIGLYKKGEVPNASGPTSIFFCYVNQQSTPINILTGECQRPSAFTPGEYSVILLANDGYTIITSVDITITEAAEVNREVVDPTCTENGYTLVTYTDGTTKKVDTVAMLGHDYEGQPWVYDSATRKHYQVCTRDASHHSSPVDCTFDDGVVTKEPSEGEAGEKLYTCGVCGGQYTAPYSGKTPTRTEVIKESTCEEEGTLRTWYEDGSYDDTPIPMTGHDYPEIWTYDPDTRTHNKVCTYDTNRDHVISEGCTMELVDYSSDMTSANFVCSVCSGAFVTPVIVTDKQVYHYGDPIMVTNYYHGDQSWIGLYKNGESYNPDSGGGSLSIFWYETAAIGQTNQLNASANDHNGRISDFTAGEYKVVIFSDAGYNALYTVNITIVADVVSTERVEPTCEEDGKVIYTYEDGSTSVEVLPKRNHNYSENWSYDPDTRQHYHACLNDSTHATGWTPCEPDEGTIVTDATDDTPGVKRYTCTVCGGTYEETFFNKTVVSEGVLIPATCEEAGVYRYTYDDGTNMDVPIPKLGHTYGDWVYDDSIQHHVRTCLNDSTHTETESCKFGRGVVSGKKVTYTCSVCNGQHVTSILATDKDVYELGEPVMTTAYCSTSYSWVGLYRAGEQYDPTYGGAYSMYWYYVVSDSTSRSGVAVNILDDSYFNTSRQEDITPGDYILVLFGDDGYGNVLATKNITIIGDYTEPTFQMDLNGVVYESNDVVTITEGEPVSLTITGEGDIGKSWFGIYDRRLGLDMSFASYTLSYWEYIQDINSTPVSLSSKMRLAPGDYSIVVFADGGYSKPRVVVYLTIQKEATDIQVIKEPTCVNYGIQLVTYDDGTSVYQPIDPLGHSFETGEWVHDAEERTHTRTCDRCSEVVTYACYFSQVEIITEATETTEGEKRYTCKDCGGSYTESYVLSAEKPTDVSRLYGNTRFETAFGIAEELKKNLGVEKFDTIILASGANFADALSGAYLANLKNAPILLCYNEEYDARTVAYVQANLAEGGTVYILGGEKAVSAGVDAALQAAGITNVKRLAGENRFETNVLILKESGVTGGEFLVCTGTNFADVLSASAVEKPILLVYNELYASQKAFLEQLSVSKFYIIGGKNAVNYTIESDLRSYSNSTMRLGGSTRYETSILIAERFFSTHDSAVLTYGMNFPDGLCGGLLANSLDCPLILTQTGRFAADAEGYAAKHDIRSGIVLGGEALISADTVRSIFQMATGNSITMIYFQ